MEQLLNGIFEYEPAKLVMLPEEIEATAAPGAVVHGSFRLESADGKRIRGFLYSSSPRLGCDPVEFQGISNEIHYQLDCSGFEAGASVCCEITVCCNLGEYVLPVKVKIEEKERTEASFLFADLDEFAALAQEEFQKAYRFFVTEEFRTWMLENHADAAPVYEGLRTAGFSYQSLEEFLVGIGKKEPLAFSVRETKLSWDGLTEPVRETIPVVKNTWGFGTITVESDAAFLRPEKKLITTDEFAGSTFDLNVVLDTNLMHSGNNYARLTLSTPRQRVCVEIAVHRGSGSHQNHIRRLQTKKIESLYVRFRLQKIDLSTWVEHSMGVLTGYKRGGGSDLFADLFMVQLLFADGKRQKAYKVLEAIEAQKQRLNTTERYAYYLYLSTFFYQEAEYVDRVEAEIGRLFGNDRTNWKLQWMLLYLKESYLSDEKLRYEAVEEQFACGCRSRIMYLEAYQILQKNPFLMRRIGPFELALLRFADREEVLTEEIVRQAANLALHAEAFDERLYEILCHAYTRYPSQELIKAVCVLLVKGEKKDPEYFAWYEKGVEQGLRITGLYEGYMETMDCHSMRQMPQIIRMYFAYDTSLDYRRRASIYRNIVENQEQDAQTFRQHRAAIERFALDQLEGTRITEDLGYLYRTFLREGMLTRQTAEKLARLLFTYEVTCSDPEIQQVIVHSNRLKAEQVVKVQDGKASVQIYDTESVVLAADGEGRRMAAAGLCSLRRVFDSGEMLEWCVRKAPEHPGIVLYLCERCLAEGLLNRNTLPYYRTGCRSEAFDPAFRDQLRSSVLRYYQEHPRSESLPEFLDQISFREYAQVDKAAMIVLLAEDGRCRDAFWLLDHYGAEGIPLMQLVRICSRMVLDLEFEENTMLTSLCYTCFANGKYDDKLLRYLLLYYEGPAEAMMQVWQAARKFELDTLLLEEKIIMMLLFTRSGTQGSEPVFEAYLKKLGRKRLCRAYVNLKAYEYFVKGQPVGEQVFLFIEKEYLHLRANGRLDEQEEVCRLALLQYYSRNAVLTAERREHVSALLEEFGAKGMRFAFWKQFDQELLLPYEMDGRVFVEYVANPEHAVTLFYGPKDSDAEFTKETMENRFEGIFVREFTLFAGEELECYLEEDDGKQTIRMDRRVLCVDAEHEEDTSRYGMLNRILRAQRSGDEKRLGEELESYLTLDYLVKEIFPLVDEV